MARVPPISPNLSEIPDSGKRLRLGVGHRVGTDDRGDACVPGRQDTAAAPPPFRADAPEAKFVADRHRLQRPRSVVVDDDDLYSPSLGGRDPLEMAACDL